MRWWKGLLWAAGVPVLCLGISFWMRPLDAFDNFSYLEQLFHGVQNRTAWVGGYRMHYEAEGPADGPPVVLIHGLGGRAEDWRALAPHLAKAGYHVYMPDLIGYGRSARPRNFSYSIHDQATLVVDFLNTVGLKRVDLGGWSMGGWIVQVMAYEHPERIKRLMLFDAAGLHVKPTWNTNVFTPRTFTELNQLDALLMPNPPHIPYFVGADILRVSKESGWVVQRAMAQMLSGSNVTDNLLPQLRMPVLIEWGSADRIIPVEQAKTIHRLVPHSHLDVYSGCGHLAPLQCAGRMAPNVIRFLKTTPAFSKRIPLSPVNASPSQNTDLDVDVPRSRPCRPTAWERTSEGWQARSPSGSEALDRENGT